MGMQFAAQFWPIPSASTAWLRPETPCLARALATSVANLELVACTMSMKTIHSHNFELASALLAGTLNFLLQFGIGSYIMNLF